MVQKRRTIRIKRTVTIKSQRRVTGRVTYTQQTRPERPAPSVRATQGPQVSRRSTLRYTPPEREFLGGIRDAVEADTPRDRDAFLCHAWDDRQGAADQFYAALRDAAVDVWFSEREVVLGRSLTRQLDAGLRVSRVGIVLVTPALLQALKRGGFADQELGALLATERVVPVVHGVSHADLRAESPLLASRAGLSTEDSSLEEVALKIAESILDAQRP